MNSSNTDLVTNASSRVLSEFFCPVKPIHIWVLSERTVFKIAAAITIIICPVAILLNILVILAIKLRRELKKHNSNILLASLAVANVLMGAVSMPLTICLDVFILLKRYLTPGIFCNMAFVNDLTLYVGGCSSTYHLAVIAWERYVAIAKSTEYKVIVTKGRVKKYAGIAWLVTVLIAIPPRIMKVAGVQYKYRVVISMVASLPGVVCIILVGYFYLRVYLCVRKRNINSFSEVRSLIEAKLATKVAKTTAMLTGAVLISFLPSSVYVFFGEAYPALRRSSFFRWSIMMTHLNSIINPVLYCYRDRRYRDAMLEMLMMKKTAAGAKKNVRRIGSAQSVEDVPENNRTPRSRIRSCGSIPSLNDTDQRRTHGQVKRGRRTSAPSRETNRVICVDIHQPKNIATKPGIQVKSGVTGKGTRSHHKDTSDKPHTSSFQASLQPRASGLPPEGSRHHHREMVRSKSLNERGLFEMIGSQHKSCQEGIRRPTTAPSTARNKTMPERELTGFTIKPAIKIKSGLTRNGKRRYVEDTNDLLQASRFQPSLQLQSLNLRPKGPKSFRHHYSEMTRTRSLEERALDEKIGSQHKMCQEAIRRPKTAPSTSRNKKMPERELTGFTRKPAIKIKSGVTRNGKRRYVEDRNDQLQASRFQPQSLNPQPKGRKSSRHHYRKMMRSKSLDERALVGKIGKRQDLRQEVIRRPKIVPSKFKSCVTRKGNQSYLEDTSDQPKALNFQALLHPQSSSLQPECFWHHYPKMTRSKSVDERTLCEMISSQHKCQQEAIRTPKSSLLTSAGRKIMPEHELTGFTTKL